MLVIAALFGWVSESAAFEAALGQSEAAPRAVGLVTLAAGMTETSSGCRGEGC